MPSKQFIKTSLFVIFSISGFSGLIYQSIWTHYLKLVLGHAAHSQTLVLAIFMGGMAIGAWLVSKKSKNISNPILIYAIIELVVGFMAIFFHQIFVTSQSFLYTDILPSVQSSDSAAIVRWIWAALLILPQSILLGATFPLMSAGIVRLFPHQTGSILSMLYFTNSIGAAIGVLVSGFILIDIVGLPGTILTAGCLNIFLAIFVWAITKAKPISQPSFIEKKSEDAKDTSYPLARIILFASFFTGLASFFYEIGWIRMLNLVLGTTTQSFELMLSAFITGLALGGLWIRKHIDNIKNVLNFAGYVQIIMGLCAVASLLLYSSTFDFMSFMMSALQRNEVGYDLFISSSHLIAFAIMIPATFMAGMTLPLFTYGYMKSGHGERGIGRIYAANTFGSIIGIFLAVHFVMPVMGLKNLISLGGFIDIILGFWLIYLGSKKTFPTPFKIAIASSISIFILTNVLAEFDKGKMASGIYRTGLLSVNSDDIVFNKDGKTSTVVVHEKRNENEELEQIFIRTNGKPDASVSFGDEPPTFDEPTMLLTAAYPLAAHPNAESAAVIGIGSGISTNTLLKTERLEIVDTIEIEKAMIEGAKYFQHHSELVYSDPRSHIYIDDAKSFFSTYNKSYDLILSEPSNPWVSGVASLFTEEFYKQLKPHLNEGGVLAQWIQIYEIDMGLVSSVFKALSKEFKYYVAYQTVNTDVVILASDDDKILELDSWIFNQQPLSEALERVDIKNISDLYARRIGTKKTLDYLFDSYGNKPNSDFFPSLSRDAPKARFMGKHAVAFTNLPYSQVPVMDLIDPLPENTSRLGMTRSNLFNISINEEITNNIYNHLIYNSPIDSETIGTLLNLTLRDITIYLNQCHVMDSLSQSLISISTYINMYLPPEKTNIFWDSLINSKCSTELNDQTKGWITLLKAVGQKHSDNILMAIKFFQEDFTINKNSQLTKQQIGLIYTLGLSAHIAKNDLSKAFEFILNTPYVFDRSHPEPLNVRLMQNMLAY